MSYRRRRYNTIIRKTSTERKGSVLVTQGDIIILNVIEKTPTTNLAMVEFMRELTELHTVYCLYIYYLVQYYSTFTLEKIPCLGNSQTSPTVLY